MTDQELLESFESSLKRFREILGKEKSLENRDSSIKRFEFTFELAWKYVQKFLRSQGIICRSPKECFQEGFKFELIQDNEKWLKMIDDRNLTVHTYNEKLAEEISKRFRDYLELFEQLMKNLKKG